MVGDDPKTPTLDERDKELLESLAETVREPPHPWLKVVIWTCGLLFTVSCLLWVLSLPLYIGVAIYTEQLLALVLGLSLCIAYHAVDIRGHVQRGLPWIDMLIGWIGLGACLWVAVEYPRLVLEMPFRTPEILALSLIISLLVCEGLRRTTGWGLLSVVIGFVLYAFVAHLAPVELRGRPVNPGPLAVYLAFDPSAMLGTTLVIGATIVVMYLWMGEVLIRSGGGEFFNDLALSLLGRSRGGSAKVAVVGSAMFSLVSGSAVANVVSSGIFTIPMMIRSGFSPRDAGAIEAVSSTGGQITPPVMGAAAFLMAEFLEIPFIEVVIAALLPAILYYWGEYVQVDLMAGKGRLKPITERIPEVLTVIKEGWHFVIPFAVLLFTMFHWEERPEIAALVATVTILFGGMLKSYRSSTGKSYRIRPSDFLGSLAATGRTTTELFMTLAASGFVVGVLNITGLGFALPLWLVSLGGESLILLLVITGVVNLILGLGMPTVAIYVLLATLAAPSLVQAGVDKMAAHMFILYYGVLSVVTPPVAVAAFAAATISKAGQFETGWAACRIGWTAFVIPFIFVASPTLLMRGDPFHIALDFVTAVIGVYCVTTGVVGWFQRNLSLGQRLLLVAGGVLAVLPEAKFGILFPGFVSLVGILAGGAVVLNEYLIARRGRVQTA